MANSSKRIPAEVHNATRRSVKARQRAYRRATANAARVARNAAIVARAKREIQDHSTDRRESVETVEVGIRASETRAFLATIPAEWIR